MALDISKDFENVCNDFHTTATLRVDGSDTSLSAVLNTPYEIKELDPTNAQVIRKGTLFVWSKDRSTAPPIGSIIIDRDGVYWTIWRYDNKHHVHCWRAFALNLNILTADANQATVLVGQYGKGDAGEAKVTWYGYWSETAGGEAEDTVEAWFQPSEEQSRLEFGADTSRETYRVYFEAATAPDDLAGGEYRLVDSDGYRYRVIRYHKENQIASLPVAICERVTEGQEWHHRIGYSGS